MRRCGSSAVIASPTPTHGSRLARETRAVGPVGAARLPIANPQHGRGPVMSPWGRPQSRSGPASTGTDRMAARRPTVSTWISQCQAGAAAQKDPATRAGEGVARGRPLGTKVTGRPFAKVSFKAGRYPEPEAHEGRRHRGQSPRHTLRPRLPHEHATSVTVLHPRLERGIALRLEDRVGDAAHHLGEQSPDPGREAAAGHPARHAAHRTIRTAHHPDKAPARGAWIHPPAPRRGRWSASPLPTRGGPRPAGRSAARPDAV